MNKANLWVSILFLGLGFSALYAADATADDLPPVPFIIGGDDVVTSAQTASAAPLMLPEEKPAAQADAMAATTQGDLTEAPAALDTADVADINELPDMTAEIPMPMPANPASGTQGIVTAETTKDIAPVATTPPAANTSEGLLPSYTFEQAIVAPVVPGNDGSRQVRGLEHTVGASNPLLPTVAVSPAVATVGEEFPELHVDQIPLQDLLTYLKDFTPKTIRYELRAPMAVTVDLKAKSVDEVWTYLMSRYPLSITSDAHNVYVRDGVVQPAPVAMPASQPVMMPVQMPAPSAAQAPVVQAPVAPAPDMTPGYTWIPAPAPVAVATSDFTPGTPVADTHTSRWDDVRTKARLYELNQERQKLLDEKSALERATRKAKIQRDLD